MAGVAQGSLQVGVSTDVPDRTLQSGGMSGSTSDQGRIVETVTVEYFCYHRDRLGSALLREELLEEHWVYMDRFATEMIARGPTFGCDGETPTGSVHIVDL